MSKTLLAAAGLFVLTNVAWAKSDTFCDRLAYQFDHANKSMADSLAAGLGGRSMAAATNRRLDALNNRMRQLIALTQMQSLGCTMPTQLSSARLYFNNARKCQRDMASGRRAPIPSCDYETWQADRE